jgi:hypothetical protein
MLINHKILAFVTIMGNSESNTLINHKILDLVTIMDNLETQYAAGQSQNREQFGKYWL